MSDWNFGYETDAGCDICGDKPGQIEPRFGYTTCEQHSVLPPVIFGQVRDGLREDTIGKGKNRQGDVDGSSGDTSRVGKEIQKGWLV